ncbi:hypothetical protein [Azospirillum isscasi]|uniref:DUF2939 domain-containing protein n=1 Tax=Azospirillum isscasi TaxID=3053926 RepID=A0ABU0WP73_9PROT|nr:hypothetical protein [Azospirillum isscasi]MDQ2106033.1 hypothetical protein [Azospirillum isscasi]
MRALAILLLFLGLSVPALAAPPPGSPEEREVAALFESARTALAQKRGAAVVPLLSRASVDKLEQVRGAARSGGDAGLAKLEPAEKFAAMGLRRYVSPADLRRMSLGELADHGMRNGWLGPNVIGSSGLGPVRVRGDRASALLMVDNRPALVPADFVREGGKWKIDLSGVFTFGSQMLKGFAAMSGKSEDAYIEDMLQKLPAKPAMMHR